MASRLQTSWGGLIAAAVAATVVVGLAAQSAPAVRVFAGPSVVTIDAMVADLATADAVVLSGTAAGAEITQSQIAVLEALARTRPKVAIATGALPRDVQEPLDHRLMEHMSDAEFLAEAHVPGDYARDARPFVEFAARRSWPLMAGGSPRKIRESVAASGLTGLATRFAAEKTWFPADVPCASGAPVACLDAETLAESVVQAFDAASIGGARAVAVGVAGVADGTAIAARTARRLPGRRVVAVRMTPAANLSTAAPPTGPRQFSEYVVYVQAGR